MAESHECARMLNPWLLLLQKLGLELKCPSCLELYKKPILLPCNHIFCGSCVPKSGSSGLECPLCKQPHVVQDLREAPYMENVVTLYRGLESTFSNHVLQMGFSEHGRASEVAPYSVAMTMNEYSALEPIHNSQEANSNSKAYISSMMEGKWGSVPCGHPGDYLLLRGDNVTTQNVMNGFTPESGTTASLLTPCSQARSNQHQKLEAMDLDTQQLKQLSNDSLPSFGNNNSACGSGDDSTESYPVNKSKKRTAAGPSAEHLRGISTQFAEKKQKKPHDAPEKNAMQFQPIICNSKNAPDTCQKSEPLASSGSQPTSVSDNSMDSISFICGFCQTWKTTENTGPMLHYANGRLVTGQKAACSNVVHVHSRCIEWAPQIYYVDENVKNLNKELARGAKLKCNKCGLKGATLGCFLKSCKRSYHVPCAAEIPECRWDLDDFLMLCPVHSSHKFPNEKSEKLDGERNVVVPKVKPKSAVDEFWAASSTGPQNWILCGSSLSAEEKVLLVKFASMCGGTVTKSWNPNVTHVIAATDEIGACTRTLKVLMAILKGKWVLRTDWIKACMERKQPVDEEAYEVGCDNHFCYDGPKNGRLSAMNDAPKLFAGMKLYFTGQFDGKYKECLKELIRAAGGAVAGNEPALLEQQSAAVDENASRLIVYNHDFSVDSSGAENVIFDLNQRRLEAEIVATKTKSVAIPHTWLLDSIASCKLQPLAEES